MAPNQKKIFEEFYQDHFQEVVAYSFSFLGQWEDAQDVAQESFQVLFKRFDSFIAAPNQVGWIKEVAKNKCRHVLRTRARKLHMVTSLEDLTNEPAVPDSSSPELTALDECARILSKGEMDLLKRIVVDKIPCAKVAEDLSITEWACYKRIQRIIKKLREQWHSDSS